MLRDARHNMSSFSKKKREKIVEAEAKEEGIEKEKEVHVADGEHLISILHHFRSGNGRNGNSRGFERCQMAATRFSRDY